MSEEVSREEIEEIVNNNDNNEEPIASELRQQSAAEAPQDNVEEEVKEEIKEEIKPKSKAKSKAKAKPKVKIVKEPVEPLQKIEEVVEEPPPPVKVDKLKEIVKCPDCNMDMTVHTLKYIHKRRGFCKAERAEAAHRKPEVESERTAPEPSKQKITQDIVNDYIKENLDVVSNYLRNERALKAQRKQMNARSLLNNAF